MGFPRLLHLKLFLPVFDSIKELLEERGLGFCQQDLIFPMYALIYPAEEGLFCFVKEIRERFILCGTESVSECRKLDEEHQLHAINSFRMRSIGVLSRFTAADFCLQQQERCNAEVLKANKAEGVFSSGSDFF